MPSKFEQVVKGPPVSVEKVVPDTVDTEQQTVIEFKGEQTSRRNHAPTTIDKPLSFTVVFKVEIRDMAYAPNQRSNDRRLRKAFQHRHQRIDNRVREAISAIQSAGTFERDSVSQTRAPLTIFASQRCAGDVGSGSRNR